MVTTSSSSSLIHSFIEKLLGFRSACLPGTALNLVTLGRQSKNNQASIKASTTVVDKERSGVHPGRSNLDGRSQKDCR